MGDDFGNELEAWLAPFAPALRNKTRRRMCPSYIAGLIGPSGRQSVQPMAARDGDVSYDQLHHFVGSSVWPWAGYSRTLRVAVFHRLLLSEADDPA